MMTIVCSSSLQQSYDIVRLVENCFSPNFIPESVSQLVTKYKYINSYIGEASLRGMQWGEPMAQKKQAQVPSVTQEKKTSEAIALRCAKRAKSPPARPRIMAAQRTEILVQYNHFTVFVQHNNKTKGLKFHQLHLSIVSKFPEIKSKGINYADIFTNNVSKIISIGEVLQKF